MANTDINQKLEQITREAQTTLEGNLLSLVLYGSHARDEAHARSDINLLMVVKDSGAVNIKPLLAVVPGWLKIGATSPVIFESAQLQRSQDTFALELAEMACAHKTLFGADPFNGYSPDWRDVRNELEHESRQKTIYLKRRWFATGGKDKAYQALMIETVPGYLALLRGGALLKRRSTDALSLDDVLQVMSEERWFAPALWKKLHAISRHREKVERSELLPLMLEYIEQSRAMVRYFDGLPDE